jgi:hypothetical protein
MLFEDPQQYPNMAASGPNRQPAGKFQALQDGLVCASNGFDPTPACDAQYGVHDLPT